MPQARQAGFEARLLLSERHYPLAAALLREYVQPWRMSSQAEDWQQGIDMHVGTRGAITAAVRIRAFENVLRYSHSFTLRTKPHDELAKLQADYYFYGWTSAINLRAPPALAAWVIMDVARFRAALADGLKPGKERDNGDGTGFTSYPILDRFTVAAQPWVPAPLSPSDGGHRAFQNLEATCRNCGEVLPTAEMAHQTGPAGQIYRVHAAPCYSEDVP